MTRQENQTGNLEGRKISVKCLSSDYDGTISPLNISRIESRVPLETRVMLRQIGRFLPISIITMKDLSFIMPRTPFANAWSGIGGLEMRIGKRVLKKEGLEPKLSNVSQAVDYAKSCVSGTEVEIEEKQDSEGRTVAFCVDWRQAGDSKVAKQAAERVAVYCKALGLKVITYGQQPFFDVYPVAPDKGWALQEMINELALKDGILYLGDSKTDNSAFKASNLSLGVVHGETVLEGLDCDYLVKFEQVPDFLHTLMMNKFVFSADFPMIRSNRTRISKQ